MRGSVTLSLLLLFIVSNAFRVEDWNPVANQSSVVVAGNARFTVLTSRLIRLEYSTSGNFEDRASTAFVNRLLPTPSYKYNNANGVLTIQTDDVLLTYQVKTTGGFSSANLVINYTLDGQMASWNPSIVNSGNLLGTIRTLDQEHGWISLNCSDYKPSDNKLCNFGLVSTLGFSLVDDTQSTMLDPNQDYINWASAVPNQDQQDWYFFGYGKDYKSAMADFTLIGGAIPLPPRETYGIFFSRYWAYSQTEEIELIDEYRKHLVPLDNLVTDMDWHMTFYKEASEGQVDQAGQPVGWTGWTWDPNLFPNPEQFLDYCKTLGLHNTLNLHPASGVQPHEALYPEMAVAMGQDPSKQIYVPFNITDQKFADNLQDIMLKPLLQQGIDFWWLDWQQGAGTAIPTLNPTFWLNHVFFNNFGRVNSPDRPLILHRWGGLGNHRYQIGFSGDVIPDWSSLDFQVYFTITASNVNYVFWSHDIGGHTAPEWSELYIRWIQWGIFSPAFRPHCTKNPDNDRRFWVFPNADFVIMRDLAILRAEFLPYLYTWARRTVDNGYSSLIEPLYYEYPDRVEAYAFQKEYFFGGYMLLAPITFPLNNSTGLASQTLWIPDGDWVEWSSGEVLTGPVNVTRNFTLSEFPAYVKAGSIIPFSIFDFGSQDIDSELFGRAARQRTSLGLRIFPGNSATGYGDFYDDGNDRYVNQYTWTEFQYTQSGLDMQVVVKATQGDYPGNPKQFTYQFKIENVYPLSSASYNGNNIPFGAQPGNYWTYDGTTLTVKVFINEPLDRSVDQTFQLTFLKEVDWIMTNGLRLEMARSIQVKSLLDMQWGQPIWQEDYESVVRASVVSSTITSLPQLAVDLIQNWPALYSNATTQVSQLKLQSAVMTQAMALMTNFNSAFNDVHSCQ